VSGLAMSGLAISASPLYAVRMFSTLCKAYYRPSLRHWYCTR